MQVQYVLPPVAQPVMCSTAPHSDEELATSRHKSYKPVVHALGAALVRRRRRQQSKTLSASTSVVKPPLRNLISATRKQEMLRPHLPASYWQRAQLFIQKRSGWTTDGEAA